MRNIDGRLAALEKQVKGKGHRGEYCTEHARNPVIMFDDGNPPKIPDNCPRCGKPYPPDITQVIISFTPLGTDEKQG